MTREEAIMWIKTLQEDAIFEVNEALLLAIEALSKVDTTENPKCLMSHEEAWAEIESDLISRADAIERVELITKCEWDNNVIYRDEVIDALKFAPSADRPTLNQTDTLIIADALRYLAEDEERHEFDRTRAEELRKQILQYGASMCHPAEAVMRDAIAEERASVQRYIDSISTEAVQGWIPCSEKLPDEYIDVLATVHGHIEIGYFMEERGSFMFSFGDRYIIHGEEKERVLKEVTAWMPLPTPYKGGDDE